MCTYSFDLPQKVSTNRKHLTNHNKVSCAAQRTGLCVGLHNKLFLQFAMQRHTVSKITLSNLHGHTCWNMSYGIESDIASLQTFVLHLQQKQGLSQATPEKFHPKESKYLPPFSHNTFKYSRLLITRTSKGNRKKFDLSGPRRK